MNGSIVSSCLDASLQGQAIVNESGEFLFVNTAFCEQIGYTKEEIQLLNIESFFINENSLNRHSLIESFLKKGRKNDQIEKVILHGKGYLQTTLFTVTDVSIEGEICFHLQLDRLMVIGKEGESSLLEKSLRNRDEVRLPKKILDGIKDAIITIRLDGQFLYVNEEAERMLDMSWKELQKSDFWASIKLDKKETLTKKFYQLLVGEEYTQVEYFHEKQEQWFDVRAYRSDEQVTMYFINITDRKKMEKELRIKEENYRSLVENTPETIMVHDGVKLIYVNPAGEKLFNFIHPQKLIGLKLNNLLSNYDRARAREDSRLLLLGKISVANTIYCFQLEHGKTIEVEATTTVIRFRGKPAFRTILKDISERKKVDDIIRKSDKLSVVAQLAAGVAHEIRNPLTTVKGFLQLFQKEQQYNSFYINLVMEELERVEAIIYEYLTLAKPNFDNHFEELDILNLVNQILTLTKTQSNMNNVTLEFEYEQVPFIIGMEKQLKQVFINLIRNSIEAVADNGTITIRILNHPDNQICIQVEDNGCGISKERIERLGEPFYSTKEKGTGLGLMVCYKIIEHHNGVLNIYSEEGKGTKMEIILPAQIESKKTEMLPL
ncbi:PAS domain-containing protein [Halalkalibacter alkaliphilus]|uniref:histidine kinase n=1 Tax=Halalkalibacter alkaliphilus TaxID=2917993 RepID=A0A9X2I5G8_9BACI|nr:PAS domain-containing sensor histidine kinase [Halalkalibacter alkaliphilus]MCL7747159.1 PAS domain S-box protein [Halalkalibacter alkaliphilus]